MEFLRSIGTGSPSLPAWRWPPCCDSSTWTGQCLGRRGVRLRDGPAGWTLAVLDDLVVTDATRAPLHPLIVQGLFRIFGKSLLVGRAFSAACGLASVAMVYLLGRQAFDRTTALLACFLAALNPLDVHHSREIRMYECLVLLTCGCWALLFSFRRGAGLGKQAAYALAMTGLCYAHPLGGLMVIALALGYLIFAARSPAVVRPPGSRSTWPSA